MPKQDTPDLIATDKTNGPGMSRRQALSVMAAMGALPSLSVSAVAPEPNPTVTLRRLGTSPSGTASDPFLHDGLVPWARSLKGEQLNSLASLCDLIIPADQRSPSASVLGCHDFIDEWISAPYERQQQDAEVILAGLTWLDEQSLKRFGRGQFIELSIPEQQKICDDICGVEPEPEFVEAGRFFSLVRDLTAGAFWTTEAGMQDLQYIGNMPLPKWELPPKAVLAHLGLETR